ncbi:MAG: MoaD/ThiS family protein [Porticoccaceae bacterium]|nr:MoaD/ThiS family protein [Porticoccaceae bacterium]
MIKVLFFAQLREKLDCSQLDVPLTAASNAPFTVADLKAQLASKGDAWQSVFTDPQVLSALNQIMCNNDVVLTNSDEVAFFPPVTGG